MQIAKAHATEHARVQGRMRVLLLVLGLTCFALAFALVSAGCGSSSQGSASHADSSLAQSANDIPASAAAGHATSFEARYTGSAMWDIPYDEEGVFTFALAGNHSNPSLSAAHGDAIEEAYDALTEYGANASFLFIDLQTGQGIGCNVDDLIFGASAIKGFYACYLAQDQVDNGDWGWADTCSEYAAYEFLDEGPYTEDDESEYTLEKLVNDAVVHSDNDAYRILRMNFDGDAYVAWLNAAGVDGDDWRFTDWWTNYSAREAAVLWMNTRDYIVSDAPSARRLWSLLGSTEVSMIRNVLSDAHEFNFELVSKAGWNADLEETQFNALGDAGLISQNGKSYLVAVLSSYPGEEDTFFLVEDLIAALWNARGDLA